MITSFNSLLILLKSFIYNPFTKVQCSLNNLYLQTEFVSRRAIRGEAYLEREAVKITIS